MNATAGKPHVSVGAMIYELSKAAQVFFQHEFAPYAIGPAQIRTLLFIAKSGELTQNDIAAELDLDKSSITSQLNILEGNGYIRRRRHPGDGRKQLISITAKTRRLLDPLMAVFVSWTATLLEGFDDGERAQIIAQLGRMKRNVAGKLQEMQHGGGER